MISVSGDGTISPIPKELSVGKTSYTLTATPASGWVFNGWQTTGLTENNKGVNPTPGWLAPRKPRQCLEIHP